MNKKIIWIAVAIVALFGVWWFYRAKTNKQVQPSQPSNFGSEGSIPLGFDPQIQSGLRTTSVFNEAENTWNPGSPWRQIN